MAKWIKSAIKHPGALTASAKRAGMSTQAFAQKHKHDSGKTGQRARLALELKGMNKGGGKSRAEKWYGGSK